MAWTYDNQDWARLNNGQIELKNADGSWSAAGTPEHAESAGYVTTAANSPEVDKLVAYARAGGTMNAEQQAFMANPLLGMDSFGQSGRWGGSQNLFDNSFDPQQSGALQQFGLGSYVPQQYLASGQQFNFDQSPAEQSKRSDSGGFGLMELAMLAAAVYSGGAALGAWGAGAGAAAGATTASGMLAAESAALLAEGFTAAEVASSLAGLGSAAEIGSVLTAAGISSATAATLAGDVASGMLTGANVGSVAPAGWTQSAWDGLMSGNYSAVTGANAGSGAMDWIDVLGDGIGAASGSGGAYPWLDASGNLDVTKFLDMTGPGGEYANLIPGGTEGIAGMDTLGSTSWLESAMNTLKANGLSPTDSLRAAKALMSGDSTGAGLLSGGLKALGGYLTGNAATGAANTAANAQLQAAQIAADAAKFKPVGITTRFGQSSFQKDANGNVIGAGYNLSPDIKAQQDALISASGGMLTQFTGSQAATAPMGDAASRMMTLGNGYLSTDPMVQSQKYMADQQALLATGRARQESGALTDEYNRGTYGLATGSNPATGMTGANPRLEALYNAQRQQDLGLAANATQGGMDYAKFGGAMVGAGGDMLNSMYGTQVAAYNPYKTAMGGAQTLEGLGQNALDQGVNMGKVTSNAQSGMLLANGMNQAAQTMQPANSYSPWGSMLSGAGNTAATYAQDQTAQQQQQYLASLFGK